MKPKNTTSNQEHSPAPPAGGSSTRSPEKEPLWDPAERGSPSLSSFLQIKAEAGAALERQLLLQGEPLSTDLAVAKRRLIFRRLRGATIILTLLLLFAFSFFQAYKHWQERILALTDQLSQVSKESSLREEGLLRDNAQKERVILERKAENQSLATLADKTLDELKVSLDDLRRLREEKKKLESEYRASLESTSSTAKLLAAWLGKWLKEGQPAVEGKADK